MVLQRHLWLARLAVLISAGAWGSEPDDDLLTQQQALEQCLKQSVVHNTPDTTIAQLRDSCQALINNGEKSNLHSLDIGVLDTRLKVENISRANRFILTPNNRNFILPANYIHHPNAEPFAQSTGNPVQLQNTEVEFQISLKVLIAQDLLHDNGNLYLAYTNHSHWQAYNGDLSRPFRETNHEPELLFSATSDWQLLGFRNVLNQVGLVHQSNGQSGTLSRSWNRIRLRSVVERGNLALSFSPWYRIPESTDSDDNPDIEDYLGRYELSAAYAYDNHIIDVTTRRLFSSRGSLEVGWSFPLRPTMRGYLKYFNGYGASLIDYNVKIESLGLGVVFTDLF